MRRCLATGLVVLAAATAGCVGQVIEPVGLAPERDTAPLDSRPGFERARACEPDHAPLRRLNHAEYARTLRDLFEGIDLPGTSVPQEARVGGFTNHYDELDPSRTLVSDYHQNAITVAPAVLPALVSRAGCSDGDDCFRRIVTDLGARAYRRPLRVDEVDAYAALLSSGPTAGDFMLALEIAVATMLQAPEFIYRPELGTAEGHLDPYEVASRLSYFIWGTMPDQALFDAAASGRLQDSGLTAEVERMLADPRAREGLIAATFEWLEIGRLARTEKHERFAFTPEVREHLRQSFERFMWERVFSEGGSIDAFFTARGAYVDSTIGPIFGVADAGPELEWRELDDRAGALTHPAILSIFGYREYGSPVLRGVFVLREILCDPAGSPPADIDMDVPLVEPEDGTPLTIREAYERHTQSNPSCATCHDQINPAGFAFEHYDAIGAYRTEDNGQPVDATGELTGFTLQEPLAFDGALELAEQLAMGTRARSCIVDRWVRYAAGGGALAYDPCFRSELEEVVLTPGATLSDLVVAIAVDPRFARAEVVE